MKKTPEKPDDFGLYFDGLLQGAVIGAMLGWVAGMVIGAWLAS